MSSNVSESEVESRIKATTFSYAYPEPAITPQYAEENPGEEGYVWIEELARFFKVVCQGEGQWVLA